MLHMMLRHLINFPCGAFTVLTYTVLFSSSTHLCEGQDQVSSPSELLVALVGDSVTLPCHLDPTTDASQLTVEWARSDLDPRFVLVWRDGIELESKKNLLYSNRTSVSADKLKLGDISLSLSSVRLSDEGTYKCFIPQLRDSSVQLVVGAAQSPVITKIDDKQSRGLVLQCNSSGWYPEPEMLWLDDEGHHLSAGQPETVRGPDDLYTISSTVAVDKKHEKNITCRIQQNDIAQTRDVHIHVPGHSTLSAPLLGGVIAVILLAIAVAFFIQRCKKKNKKKSQGDVESQRGEDKNEYESPENTPLINSETDGEKQSENMENERTNTQEDERQQGREEQETDQDQAHNVLVHTASQTVDKEQLQTRTQQHGHTSDEKKSQGDVESQRGEDKNEYESPENTPLINSETDGQEEQETDQDQAHNVLVHTDSQTVNKELQTRTQQHGHTSDGNVGNGSADSDVNIRGVDETTPVSHSKHPPEKQDEDKTQEDPEAQCRGEETGAEVQNDEENHEEQLLHKAEKEGIKTNDKMKNKLQQIEREKKKGEDKMSKVDENLKNQESQLNEVNKQLEELDRRPQEGEDDISSQRKELLKKKQKLEKALERTQKQRAYIETKTLKSEKEKSEIMTKEELQKRREEDEEEDEDQDL